MYYLQLLPVAPAPPMAILAATADNSMKLRKVPAVVEHNVVTDVHLIFDVLHLFLGTMPLQNAANKAPLCR
eukprot:CAMPEP_0172805076 /NCGR_PEP_ID=MMETSP1075-20121228/5575_1 /TAXON_ID=2916 /ORGANISM="Ceratium fusus, Strain PA161109" /LENGTH=70 /DNA_ID=CAMNT_0013643749 /DNA_START=768 /DNA_END=980 /DNA_ORIENTATION=-